MAKISKTPDNVFAIPKGAVVTKNGYVYVNISNYYIPAKDGKKGYTSHEKKCVGVNIDGKTMYANDAYFVIYRKEDLPPPPEKSDRIRVGIKSLCEALRAYVWVKIHALMLDNPSPYAAFRRPVAPHLPCSGAVW